MEYVEWAAGAVYSRRAMKAKGNAWDLASEAVNKLPPYLQDDELTADRLQKQNPKQLHSMDDARKVLDGLVEAGELVKEERRSGKGGGHIFVYVAKGKT